MSEYADEMPAKPAGSEKQKLLNFNDADILTFAWIVYSEMADDGEEEMFMCGSCLYNMIMAGRPEEFGTSIDEIGRKKFYGYSGKNDAYWEFYKFMQCDSDWDIRNIPAIVVQKGCQAYKTAIDLIRGFVTPMPGLFYFEDKEQTMLRMTGRFDFSLCRQTGRVGKYNVWTYKEARP